MNKKFRLIGNDRKIIDGKLLYRIQALRDIGKDIKRGDLGGYVESEANLSTEDDSWLYPDMVAYGDNIWKEETVHDIPINEEDEIFKPDEKILNKVVEEMFKDNPIIGEQSKNKDPKGPIDVASTLENKLLREKEHILNLLKLSFHSECKLNSDLNTMMYVGQIAEVESVLKMVEEIKNEQDRRL